MRKVMTNEPDLDSIMTRLLAEIAGVRSEVAGLRADLTAQKVLKGQWNILRALQMAREKR
jgi:hypothetical protein